MVTLFGLSLGTTKSFGSCPPVRGKSGKEGKECAFYFLIFFCKFDFSHFRNRKWAFRNYLYGFSKKLLKFFYF